MDLCNPTTNGKTRLVLLQLLKIYLNIFVEFIKQFWPLVQSISWKFSTVSKLCPMMVIIKT